MNFKDKLIIWGIVLAVLLLFISVISGILLPFVVAIIAAYFLDPAADKLEEWGCSRTIATISITSAFFIFLGVVIILLAPLLYDQFVSLVQKVPTYIAMINEKILPSFSSAIEKLSPDAVEKAKAAVSDVSVYMFSALGQVAKNVWSSGIAIVNLLSLVFITPIVTFYILRDWDRIVAKINDLLPPKHASVIRKQIKNIDTTLSGYIRGQTNVCLLLGIFYAVGLTIVGLDFGFFIGLATGILSFIPYVGMLFGFSVGIIIAIFQFSNYLDISIVAAIFIVGNVLEGMFIAPNLVGDKVGLHPVWIIFGMLAGAAMFGFVGILIAIPATAVIGVLVRFFVAKYLKSTLYNIKKPAAK